MRRLVAYAIAVIAGGPGAAAAGDDATWSEASNGLRARLVMRLSHVSNGTGIVVTHLELSNVRDSASPMLVTVHQSLTYRVTDADGRDIPMTGGAFSGPVVDTPDLVLPHDSSIRFRIGPRGRGIPGDQAALLDLGSSFGWVLPRDGRAYYLHAVMEIPKAEDDQVERGVLWHGRLDLPRVRIPTEPEPVDPAKLGPLIDELGAKMLAGSEAAVRELSLIDDPRVVPWYVKAVKTDSYDLKFHALDRMARLEGDAALEGLRIGMATEGKDIGSCTTPAVAASLAENIRHAAAGALARSPHTKAKALLLSMEEDPAMSVRITVVQAAARMKTPESLALLERRTQDGDATVRGEAVRLLPLPPPPPEFRGTELQWRVKQGNLDVNEMSGLLKGLKSLKHAEGVAVLSRVRLKPNVALAPALVEAADGLPENPIVFAYYSAACLSVLRAMVQSAAQDPPTEAEARDRDYPRTRVLASEVGRKLLERGLGAEARRVVEHGKDLDHSAWAGVLSSLEGFERAFPDLRSREDCARILAQIEGALLAELGEALEPRPGYRGGVSAIRLAAWIGSPELLDLLLRLFANHESLAKKLPAPREENELVARDEILRCIAAKGSASNRADLARLIAEELASQRDEQMRKRLWRYACVLVRAGGLDTASIRTLAGAAAHDELENSYRDAIRRELEAGQNGPAGR